MQIWFGFTIEGQAYLVLSVVACMRCILWAGGCMLAVCWQSVLPAGGGVGRHAVYTRVLWIGTMVWIQCVLWADGCVPALCSTGWWLWACSMFMGRWWCECSVFYGYSTGWQLCACSVFYGQAVEWMQCFSMSILRAGGYVPAVCSTGWWLCACDSSTGRRLWACSVFYGQAVVWIQCFLWAGNYVLSCNVEGGCVLAIGLHH